MCVIVSLWSLCGTPLFFSQEGGAIYNSNSGSSYNPGGALTFEGSATFTSCSAVASDSSDNTRAVSGGE